MQKRTLVALASLLILVTTTFTTPAQANIVNGSFEDGLTGWTANDDDNILISLILATDDPFFASGGIPVPPTDGDNRLILTSGIPEASLSQEIFFPRAGILSLDLVVTSYEEELGDNNDVFRITLGANTIYEKDVATLGPMGNDFAHVEYAVSGAGTMLLTLSAITGGATYGFPLYGVVDNIVFTPTTVPLPGAVVLLMSALLVSPLRLRKKMSV